MFRVIRREKKTPRPEWVTKMLLSISPTLYDKVYSVVTAKQNLKDLAKAIEESKLCREGFSLQFSEDALTILRINQRPYITFSIISCYDD